MALKVTEVASARKAPGKCQLCGVELQIGDSYKYAASRFAGKQVRCADCPMWTFGELDTSKMATAILAQEAATKALMNLDAEQYEGKVESLVDDITAILEECASDGEACRDDYQEGLDNMPEGLQDGDVGQQIQEKIDALDTWVDELGSWSNSEEFDAESVDWVEYVEATVAEAQELIDSLET